MVLYIGSFCLIILWIEWSGISIYTASNSTFKRLAEVVLVYTRVAVYILELYTCFIHSVYFFQLLLV